MRTTINIDDQLLMQAKAQAAASGVILAQLIEDALRENTGSGLVFCHHPRSSSAMSRPLRMEFAGALG